MRKILDIPLAVLGLSLLVLWISAQIGIFLQNRFVPLAEDERQDLSIVIPATLTLLGLLIGFSFYLATNRYDQPKNCEEDEAKASRTEYVRTDLLSPPDAARVRELLRDYLNLRVQFMRVATDSNLGVSKPKQHNCRPNSGPQSKPPPIGSRATQSWLFRV